MNGPSKLETVVFVLFLIAAVSFGLFVVNHEDKAREQSKIRDETIVKLCAAGSDKCADVIEKIEDFDKKRLAIAAYKNKSKKELIYKILTK